MHGERKELGETFRSVEFSGKINSFLGSLTAYTRKKTMKQLLFGGSLNVERVKKEEEGASLNAEEILRIKKFGRIRV